MPEPSTLKNNSTLQPAKIQPQTYERIRRMLYDKAGIDLRQGKEELVTSQLGKKLRETGCGSYEEYLNQVSGDRTGESLTALIDVLTTNFTSFLREPAHFTFLREKVLPNLADRDTVRIWCAAAATGEEPYSLIFSMLEGLGQKLGPLSGKRCQLLATDLSTQALATARKGIYPEDRLAGIPREWMSRYFLRGDGNYAGLYQVKREAAALIEFAQLNLIENFTVKQQFPVIFCRNVMIYFDRQTQERVVNQLVQFLEPGGYLVVGHSESLNGIAHPLSFVQPAVYRFAGPGGNSHRAAVRDQNVAESRGR